MLKKRLKKTVKKRIVKITKVKKAKKRKNRYHIYIDEEYKFSCSGEFLAEKRLLKDSEISREELEVLLNDLYWDDTRDYLVSIIAGKDYTERELRTKLIERKTPGDIIDRAMDYLKERQFIDERRFLSDYLSYLTKKGKYSRREIEQKVLKKGFSKDVMENIKSLLADYKSSAVIENLMEKQVKRNREKEKIFSYLLRKGFDYEEIKKVWKQLNKEKK
ncbi:MAG: regulatory protein RecX [bacterium]